MLYPSAAAWRAAPRKKLMVFGMSGLGKTHLSKTLVQSGRWFHYSVDYRIGTYHLYPAIKDNLIAEARKLPFFADLLRKDAIYIEPNVHDFDLSAVASYLGKPGNPALGGLPMAEYAARQDLFRRAEIAALNDTAHFAERGAALYDYPNFICDTGGSICEWVDPSDDHDPLMATLAAQCLPVWIKGDAAHTERLIARFDAAPKPMAYQPDFLARTWAKYLSDNNRLEGDVDPDDFIRWTYAQALAHRQPRYAAMARWGVTVTADQVADIANEADLTELIAGLLP